ncbi:MAG: AraC family transcriptional regulator [Saccharofermentans sp.]|nr:AraC family transcriptional regulator [Saccharofermentans sp.]
MDKYKKVSYQEYLNRDYRVSHAPLFPEMDFYNSIRMGDVKKVRKLCSEPLHLKEGLGELSEDKLRNMKYHFVVTCGVVARICIEGGMMLSESYGMSDFYIQQADHASSVEEVSELHDEMCIAYAKRMREIAGEQIYSKPVTKCIDYIYDHFDERVKMRDLCEVIGLSEAYLSRLFKKETGLPVSRYILLKKIDTAKNMLRYSDYPIMHISNSLAFPSQSYFTRVFTNETGMTPGKFRDM